MILKLRQKRKPNLQMQYVTRVRDACRSSKKNSEVLVNGYHGCIVAACRVGGRKTIPLALRLWSSRAPGFKGENDEVLNIIKSATVWIGRNVKHEILAEHLKYLSKRMGQIPEFAAYSIAEGIKRAFTRFGNWIRTFAQTNTPDASTADAPMLPGFLEFFEVDYG